jgi:hypothetical protein
MGLLRCPQVLTASGTERHLAQISVPLRGFLLARCFPRGQPQSAPGFGGCSSLLVHPRALSSLNGSHSRHRSVHGPLPPGGDAMTIGFAQVGQFLFWKSCPTARSFPLEEGGSATGVLITDECQGPCGDANQESSWLFVPKISLGNAPADPLLAGFYVFRSLRSLPESISVCRSSADLS